MAFTEGFEKVAAKGWTPKRVGWATSGLAARTGASAEDAGAVVKDVAKRFPKAKTLGGGGHMLGTAFPSTSNPHSTRYKGLSQGFRDSAKNSFKEQVSGWAGEARADAAKKLKGAN